MKAMRTVLPVIILAAVCLLFPQCGDGPVMARAGAHAITRGQLMRWLRARGDDVDSVMAKKEEQRLRLRRLALELLIADEAAKEKFDSSESFQLLSAYLERNFRVNYFEDWIKRNGWFEGEAVQVLMIRLPLTGDTSGDRAQRAKAAAMAAGMSKGAEPGKIDPTVHAETRFLVPGIKGIGQVDAVFSLAPGEILPQPVEVGGGLHIVKILKKHRVTSETFSDLMINDDNRRVMEHLLSQRTLEYLAKRLRDEKDVIDNTGKAGEGGPEALLFSVGTVQFRNGDLDRLLGLVYAGKGPKDFTKKMRVDWAGNLLTELLLSRYICGKGLCGSGEYGESWKATRQQALAARYFDEKVMGAFTVTEDEMIQEYVREKDILTAALKKGIMSPAEGVLPPFMKVKESIRRDLVKRKRLVMKRQWEMALLEKNGFMVIEGELDGE